MSGKAEVIPGNGGGNKTKIKFGCIKFSFRPNKNFYEDIKCEWTKGLNHLFCNKLWTLEHRMTCLWVTSSQTGSQTSHSYEAGILISVGSVLYWQVVASWTAAANMKFEARNLYRLIQEHTNLPFNRTI